VGPNEQTSVSICLEARARAWRLLYIAATVPKNVNHWAIFEKIELDSTGKDCYADTYSRVVKHI
jgi:hypothetical protein